MQTRDRADAEHAVLTTKAGLALLAEVATVAEPGPADLTRWRNQASIEQVAAAIRLTACRRRGAAKFHLAHRMWLDPVGLEQATAEVVARHKARRFQGATVVDLCSGIGGDALAMAAESRVVAVDFDPDMPRRLRWNAEVHGVADRLLAARGRAEAFSIPEKALVHVDPDRRAGLNHRYRSRLVCGYMPGLGVLNSLMKTSPGGALKLGPASDFETHFDRPGIEIELISLGGECKEATAWFGSLAIARRRATCLPSGASWTDADGRAGPVVKAISSWVFDPDAALVRAGLLDGFADSHGLARLADGIDLLTGPLLVDSPWLAAFEVRDVVPLDLKRLRRLVAELGLGPLEIKTKGLPWLRPDDLRRRLHPGGPHSATLLLHGGPGAARAIVARRLK